MTQRCNLLIGILVACFLLNGCVSVKPSIKAPSVVITHIAPSKGGPLSGEIDVRVRISNPNAFAIPLKAMDYTIHLNGAPVLRGASRHLPKIPAHGSREVTLTIGANPFTAPKLIVQIALGQVQSLDWVFESTVDFSGPWATANIYETGSINLR